MAKSALYAGYTYEEALREFAQAVAGVCMMQLQNHADAEDCFQNTFVKLLTKQPKLSDENHLKNWLLRVAVNECHNLRKKNRRTVSIEEVTQEPSYCQSDDTLDVSWALMKLKPDYREILYLHYCEGYKVDEIARLLGRNQNTIKVMFKRGREMLKAVYGGDEK